MVKQPTPFTFFGAVVILCALFVTLALLLWVIASYAHDSTVRECFNKGAAVKPMGAQAHPSGLWAEAYARRDKVDVVTLSPITGYQYNWDKIDADDLVVEHGEHPIAYMVDKDGDEKFDESFVDKVGEGKCADIQHYEYLNQREGEDDMRNPKKETRLEW